MLLLCMLQPLLRQTGASITIMDIADATLIWISIHPQRKWCIKVCRDSYKNWKNYSISYFGFWFPELKFLTFSNHYIQWCRCHVVIITCRKLHCQEKPWPPKNSSFKMLIFPYTLLYIVHVSTNPLLLTMTLWEVTITDNCCHWKNRKKIGFLWLTPNINTYTDFPFL